MCGIVVILLGDSEMHCNQMLFDALTMLQHRGQDAAGMITSDGDRLYMRKDNGLVKDVFLQHHMQQLVGSMGIAHCRYPTAGSSSSAEAQPMYTNFPFGICIAHNGNLTNAEELRETIYEECRHINTDSDSELLLNVFAEELTVTALAAKYGGAASLAPVFGKNAWSSKEHLDDLDISGSSRDDGYSLGSSSYLKESCDTTGFHDVNKLPTQSEEQSTATATTTTSTTLGNGLGVGGENSASTSTSNSNSIPEVANNPLIPNDVFKAVRGVMARCRGGYAVSGLINGKGILGFRDPYGIRPLCIGCRPTNSKNGTPASLNVEEENLRKDWVLASESAALDTLQFELVREVRAGEAVFIDMDGNFSCQQCVPPMLSPCLFEFVYFARPDSVLDGVVVYESRLNMGATLARKIERLHPDHDIEVVIPVPDTSRTSALQTAYTLNKPFREGFIKNRYIARTFIMPGQASRKKTIRLKLNTIRSEFKGKNVLLVDDSIVRGTTSTELVQMAREAGAKKVYLSSAAPPVRYPNVYGIDIPTREELIAFNRTEDEVAQQLGADWVVYQDLSDLEESISSLNPDIKQFDSSCFSGRYVSGDIDQAYLDRLCESRNEVTRSAKSGTGKLTDVSAANSAQARNPCPPVIAAAGSWASCEGIYNDM